MSRLLEELVRHSAGIQDALDACADPTPLEEVFRTVLEQEAFLWTWGDCGMIATVREYPHASNHRECLVWLGWGNRAVLEDGLAAVEAWAKASGAKNMSVMGRKGWERTFLTRRSGYRPTAVLYTKEI
jgi:hypothetical protein